jgi:hypothetical protein
MILLVFGCSSCFSSARLPLLLETGLTLAGELSNFPFAFSFSNFILGVAFMVGEGMGWVLAGVAAPSVVDSVELGSAVVFFLVLRGVLQGEAACLDTEFLVFGESDDGKTTTQVGVGAGSGSSTAASSI